jgi:hypothetical protein
MMCMLTVHAVGPSLLLVTPRANVLHKLAAQLHQLINTWQQQQQQ